MKKKHIKKSDPPGPARGPGGSLFLYVLKKVILLVPHVAQEDHFFYIVFLYVIFADFYPKCCP